MVLGLGKRLRRMAIFGLAVFATGYAVHLGGCDSKKLRGYYNAIATRFRQGRELAEESTEKVKTAYEEGERIYNENEPKIRKTIEYLDGLRKKLDEESKKKESEKKDKEKDKKDKTQPDKAIVFADQK